MSDDEINITSRPEGARGKRMTAADERIAELEAILRALVKAVERQDNHLDPSSDLTVALRDAKSWIKQ